MTRIFSGPCPVCGGSEFAYAPVLWPGLIEEWQLAPAEADYINRQQGLHCTACNNNLRSMALATAILLAHGLTGTLREAAATPTVARIRLLELNAAGDLTPALAKFPGHFLARYPEYDMCRLDLGDGSFDCILHSDVLEHVPDPGRGLAECLRVLTGGGTCIFTVPTVVGRMTRSRTGMQPSYHGAPGSAAEDFRVHNEFGADVWTMVLAAGFADCRLVSIEYPAGLALIATKPGTRSGMAR